MHFPIVSQDMPACYLISIITSFMPFLFRARYLDSRALSKLGVYIPKPDLNSFLIRDEYDGKVVISVTANNLNLNTCVALFALVPFSNSSALFHI